MVWATSLKSLKPARIIGQPSLQTKGLAILGIFMFFVTIFFATLYWNNELAEAESRREEHYKIILKKTQGLVRPFSVALDELSHYVEDKDPEHLKNYEAGSAEVFDSLEWLKKQLAGDKECGDMLKTIEAKLEIGRKRMQDARKKCETISDPARARAVLGDIKQSYQSDWMDMIIKMKDLVLREEKIVSASPEEQRRVRRLVRTLLVAGYAGICVVVAVIIRFFMKEIVARLTIMVDDTQRFSMGKELNPLMPVKDHETSLLNRAFHDMARQVQEAQRMRQTFVAMISHDLRTPLTSVQGYLELVSIGAMGEASEKTIKGADIAKKNVGRLIRLVSDLLDLEKMEAGKMKMAPRIIYLETVIEKSIQAVEEFAASQKVKLKYSECDAEVFADPDRLIQVVVNLLSNAIKFSSSGGTVAINTIEKGELVELLVIDQGRGVPPEYRQTIFEKYKQVKTEDGTKKGGTGLGLPICKLIIEQSGGSIGVDSEEGKGSTFWFKLPKVTTGEADQSEQPAESEEQETERDRRKVPPDQSDC
jgi:signal transduction histidine kinase